MALRTCTLGPDDAAPPVRADRGVTPTPSSVRALHRPDASLLLLDDDALVARCSCWWTGTAAHQGAAIGVIGHYADNGPGSAAALLSEACALLGAQGRTVAVGPMDGNTWRPYRFVVDRGDAPPFFLEPDHPPAWPGHWDAAGFAPLATYTSAVNEDLLRDDPPTPRQQARVAEAGVTIRPFDPSRADHHLRRIHALSLAAFADNFLYTPIAEAEFLGQNAAILPYLDARLVLLAEREDALVGFVFAIPNVLQARGGGSIDTFIVKTLAVHPSVAGIGLGAVLLDAVQRAGRAAGFRRAIHALMHESNVSRRMSDRSARTIRRYALFSRPLVP